MAYGFVDQLMAARRRAQLSGRPLSSQETASISQGYASAAADKALAAKELSQEYQMHTEELAQRQREVEAEQKAAREEKRGKAAATLGAGLGYVIGGPVGAFIGSAIGGGIGGGCIIISSCTSPESHEVKIAREYRDNFLDSVTLDGYYVLASFIVPLIKKSRLFKFLAKRILVNRLVDFGAYFLGYNIKMKYRSSRFITKKFLYLCRFLGYLNAEMEVAKNG